MKQIIIIAGILLLGVISCKKESGAPDSEQLVMATLWFQQSAEARALFYQAYNTAELRVRWALDTLPAEMHKAVVVDIDETILDNSPSEGLNIKEGQRYTEERWKTWTANAEAKALPGSLEFANYLENNGVELFYISNRSIDELEPTLENLQKLNFPYADREHILLKTDESSKKSRRAQVLHEYHIICLLGDNLNDFSEFFEDRSELLGFPKVDAQRDEFGKRFIVTPNPLYGSWSKPIYGSTSAMSPAEIAKKRRNAVIVY